MNILSPETDKCSSWISGKGENDHRKYFHEQISMNEYCQPSRGQTGNLLDTSRTASKWATEASPGKKGYPYNIFLISAQKHMLWVLSRSASKALLMPTHNTFSWIKISIFFVWNKHLIWRYETWLQTSINPSHAEQIKMPCPLLIFSQSDYILQIADISSYTDWQTVQIQISSEANWSGSTLFAKAGYIRIQQDKG